MSPHAGTPELPLSSMASKKTLSRYVCGITGTLRSIAREIPPKCPSSSPRTARSVKAGGHAARVASLLDMYCDFTADKRYQLADWRIRCVLIVEVAVYSVSYSIPMQPPPGGDASICPLRHPLPPLHLRQPPERSPGPRTVSCAEPRRESSLIVIHARTRPRSFHPSCSCAYTRSPRTVRGDCAACV